MLKRHLLRHGHTPGDPLGTPAPGRIDRIVHARQIFSDAIERLLIGGVLFCLQRYGLAP